MDIIMIHHSAYARVLPHPICCFFSISILPCNHMLYMLIYWFLYIYVIIFSVKEGKISSLCSINKRGPKKFLVQDQAMILLASWFLTICSLYYYYEMTNDQTILNQSQSQWIMQHYVYLISIYINMYNVMH